MNADDKIRAILRMEADAVEPSPAGWDAIQQGVASRRARPWWTFGAALAGAAAVFLGVTTYVAVTDRPQREAGVGPASPPAASVSGVPTPAPSALVQPVTDAPLDAIWPLTTRSDVTVWEADPETYPALKTAKGAALAFARTYLGIPEAEVLGKEQPGESVWEARNGTLAASQLTVRGFGTDGDAPYVVVRAHHDALLIATPKVGAYVSGVFDASGTFEGVEPAIDVHLRGDSPTISGATVRAESSANGWTARVSAAGRTGTGSLLVTAPSGLDGSVAAAAAVPVRFGQPVEPKVFVAARDGRIALLSVDNGAVVRWLTAAEPGAGASDPELSDDGKSVVYVQSAGTCASEIRSVPVGGGEPTTLVPSGDGRLSHPSRRRDVLAYARLDCAAGNARWQVVVRTGGETRREDTSEPVGPVLGERFAAYVTTDAGGRRLRTVDVLGELADSETPAPEGCTWTAAAWGPRDANGREQLFAAATCAPSTTDEPQTRLYRFDADGLNRRTVATVAVPAPAYLDFAGDLLVIGTADDAAYTYVDGTLRQVSGRAGRPTWS
ncbi:MAG TPA: hypothetical protein VNA20_04280 [Frankiaceae bacterium]|nr:hypothetical protein [Frankiaceae bacterium]